MAIIVINNERQIQGRLTFTRSLDMSGEKPMLTMMGTLMTHRYFEEIHSIETERLQITGVTVIEESFGSESHEIAYTFHATGMELVGGESHLSEPDVLKLENKLYGADDEVVQPGGENNDAEK